MLKFLFPTFLLLFALPFSVAEAKQKSYSWIIGMCDARMRYDASTVKEKALKDTVYLIYDAYSTVTPVFGMVSVPEDIRRLDRAAFAKECKGVQDKLTGLQLLQIPGPRNRLEQLRQEMLDANKAYCAFQDMHMRGYSDPAVLHEYQGAAECEKFIAAAEDDQRLESAWRAYVKTLCANNASVADCSKRELAKAKLPDAKAHMRITMISFAWNNCANPTVWRDSDDVQKRLQMAAKSFERQYKVKQVCQEP
jgi:hypothetical protein